jgi:hypothetical protein
VLIAGGIGVFTPKKFDKASPEAGYGRGESNSPLPALR